MTIKEFLELDKPWEYDFKFLRYSEDDAIERFWEYKKASDGFDCDCAPLTMEIQCLLYGASAYQHRYFRYNGEKVETDTINGYHSRYLQTRKNNLRFAQLTHAIGNFNVGPVGFGGIKAPYTETKQIGDWSNFDRFDSFCEKHAEMKKWFFEHRYNTFMDMYFNSDGSLVPLDNVDIIIDLIVKRGKQIAEKLRSKQL